MIELFEQDIQLNDRQSSKGKNYSNELKDRVYYLVTRQMKKYQYLFC